MTITEIVKKAFSLVTLKLFIATSGFMLTYVLAQALGAEQFGLFSLVLTITVIVSAFIKQGLDPLIVKVISGQNNFKAFGFLFGYAAVTAVLVVLLLLLFSPFILTFTFVSLNLAPFITMVALSTVALAITAINAAALKALAESAQSLFLTGGGVSVCSLILVLIVAPDNAYTAFELFSYAAVFLLLVSFALLFLSVASRENKQIDEQVFSQIEHWQLLKENGHFFVITLCVLLSQQLPALILAGNVSLAEIGAFSLALKVSVLMGYPLVVIKTFTMPKFAKLYANKNYKGLSKLYLDSQRVLGLIAAVAVVTFYIFSEFVSRIFGADFQLAELLLKILIIGQFVNLVTGSSVSILLMTGQERLHQRNTLIITAILVVLLFIFIPLFGVWGAVILMTMSMIIKNVVSWYYVRLTFNKHRNALHGNTL